MANDSLMHAMLSNWVGAFFYWMINGFKGKYQVQISEEKVKRNIWTGYVIILSTIILVIISIFSKI